MPSQEKMLELIGRIYDAAADPRLWPAFLNGFADTVAGTTAGIVEYDLRTLKAAKLVGIRFDPDYARRWVEYYCTVDEWFLAWWRRFNRDGAEAVAISEELVDLTRLKKTEFFNDYLLPQQQFHQLGGAITKEDTWCVGFTCHRTDKQGPFGTSDVEFLHALMPHLKRAVQFERRFAELDGRHRGSLDALDGLSIGIILLDDRGRILIINKAAKRTLDQNDGLAMRREGLAAGTATEHQSLWSLIGAAGSTTKKEGFSPGAQIGIVRPSGKRPLSLLVMPSSANAFPPEAGRPAVIIFVSDPEQQTQTIPGAFAQAYALTVAESRVAERLMQGETLVQAAVELGVSHNTARTHLQRIYQKTETSHQGDLVRLLVSSTSQLLLKP